MGMGEIFRAVAAALQSGAQFPLDEAEKRRQIREKVELAKFKSTNDPLEQLLMQARIDSLNRRNLGGGGGGRGGGSQGKTTAIDRRVESIIQAEEVQRGQPYDPRDRAKRQAQLLGASLFKPSSTDYGDEEINPLTPIPVPIPPPRFLLRQGTPAPAAAPTPTNNASVIQEANEAIRRGADPAAVKERLRKLGVQMQ